MKTWKNQRLFESISNYMSHFRSSHKYINLTALENTKTNSKYTLIN
jgi:hypothetical protein